MRTQGRLAVVVRVFSVISAVIVVSENADRYPGFAPGDAQGMFVEIDPVKSTTHEATLLEAMGRLSRELSAGNPTGNVA